MSKIILVTGGARSGKSGFAEDEIRKLNTETAYIATAIAFDDGMKNRIRKHKLQRPSTWKTYEKPTNVHEIIAEINKNHSACLLDCITVMLTNYMMDELDFDHLSEDILDEFEERVKSKLTLLVDEIEKTDLTFYMVTNEVGSGIVPDNKVSSFFRDLAGRMNQYLARRSDEVYALISGIPVKIKG